MIGRQNFICSKYLIKVLFVQILLFISTYAYSQVTAINRIIEATLQTYNIPGMAVGVVSGDSIILMRGYGDEDIQTGMKVDMNTNFYIASLTKVMTAYCIGTLVDSGKISWDDPINNYLNNFRFSDACADKVLVGDILSMNLGSPYLDTLTLYPDLPGDELLYYISKHDLPGFRHSYSYGQGANIGFVLAGKIIEEISGMPYNQFLSNRLFSPLEMNNSFVYGSFPVGSMNCAKPYKINKRQRLTELQYPNVGFFISAAGVISNVNDLMSWLLLINNKGCFNEKQLLSHNAWEDIISPHNIVSKQWMTFYNPEAYFNLYGYGWVLSEYRTKLLIEHTGSMYGYSNLIAAMPEEKIGIIILSNIQSETIFNGLRELKFKIIDELLPGNYK